MTQTVTLELPDVIYQPAQRMAEAMRRPLTEVLVGALRASLPPVKDVPAALAVDLTALEHLSDDKLWEVMSCRVSNDQQRKLSRLLSKKKNGKLNSIEQNDLGSLQLEADRVMLRKARAAVLLRFRGHRLPTLSELRKLTFAHPRMRSDFQISCSSL